MVDCDIFGKKRFPSPTYYNCDKCPDKDPCLDKWLENSLFDLKVIADRPTHFTKKREHRRKR